MLGVNISEDLKWNKNTEELVKSTKERMRLLHIASKFTSKVSDLTTNLQNVHQNILESSAVVWHSSLSVSNVT